MLVIVCTVEWELHVSRKFWGNPFFSTTAMQNVISWIQCIFHVNYYPTFMSLVVSYIQWRYISVWVKVASVLIVHSCCVDTVISRQKNEGNRLSVLVQHLFCQFNFVTCDLRMRFNLLAMKAFLYVCILLFLIEVLIKLQ